MWVVVSLLSGFLVDVSFMMVQAICSDMFRIRIITKNVCDTGFDTCEPLLGPNISSPNMHSWIRIFLFPRWDMWWFPQRYTRHVGQSKVPPGGWTQILLYMGWCEVSRGPGADFTANCLIFILEDVCKQWLEMFSFTKTFTFYTLCFGLCWSSDVSFFFFP